MQSSPECGYLLDSTVLSLMAFSLLFSFWSHRMNKGVFLWVGVDLNSVHNLKVESDILFGGGF